VLKKYCYECHGGEKQEAGIDFRSLLTTDQAFRAHKLLEKISEQVISEDMPPFEADAFPTPAEKLKLQQSISHVLGKIERGDIPRNPGRVTIRRINRNEYNYTVRDLLGVKFSPGRNFPADASGGEGFDNTADTLFLPPVLMEHYLKAAQSIIESVYTSPKLKKRLIFVSAEEQKKTPTKAARRVLTFYASLAYRRKVTDQDIVPLLKSFQKKQKAGADFDASLRPALTAVLVSPKFLFRIEHDEAGKKEWPLDQFELATRLSYFLWSSMPDRTLFNVANEGKLREPAVLRQQIQRMLASPKANALSRHFAGQWLGFDALINESDPDKKRFPSFTRSLRASMYYEATSYFSHIVRKNRPITELIDSDYAFLNAELARHYSLPAVSGNDIRKVAITDNRRGGVIGMGSILTTTSLPLRTSPVRRGKWILESLLGTPPPPPPADAGELPADDKSSEGLSFRKQLEIHRKKSKCSGCHAQIDPLGFSMENYDAIGRWRTKDIHGLPVDTDAALPDGTEFSRPDQLKKILLYHKDKIARNLCRKMLAYALGRPLEYYDEPVINDLLKKLRADNYRIQSLIVAITESHPFQNRSANR
ncbi:MAG: DUF1592 domain-containing protein, partial [Akkermansiaceae bacterium]